LVRVVDAKLDGLSRHVIAVPLTAGDDRDRALDRHVRSTDQRPKLILPRSWIPVMLWPSEPPRRNPDPPPDPQPDPDPPKPPAQRPDAAVVSFAKFRRQSEPSTISPPETATGPTEPNRTDAVSKPPPEPRAEELIQEPPRTENEVLDLIYRRKQTETCESIADALRHVQMQDWEPDDFDRLAKNLEAHAQWDGDHNGMAHEFVMFAGVPALFGTADGILIYDDGLKVLRWAQAMARIAPQVEEAKCRREAERRREEGRQIISSRLPAKRKLAAMKTRLDQLTALQPTTINPETALAIDFIRAMLKDDERFADCRTFYDYLLKAIEITLPPPPKDDAREPSDLASMWDSNPTATARDLSEPDCTDDTTEQSHAAVETPAPDTEVSKTDDLILDHPLPTADRKQAFFGAVNCCRHLTENDQAIVQWIGWLIINDVGLTERMLIACDTPRQILAAAALLREQRPMLRDVPLDAFKPEPDPLDLPLPPIGERLAALGDIQFEQLTFGGGKASRDEHDLRELKSYAVALLQYHNMEVRVLLHRKREFWRPFMNDTTLRRLYETVFPPKPEGGYT
jgi:hypothetical protein